MTGWCCRPPSTADEVKGIVRELATIFGEGDGEKVQLEAVSSFGLGGHDDTKPSVRKLLSWRSLRMCLLLGAFCEARRAWLWRTPAAAGEATLRGMIVWEEQGSEGSSPEVVLR